MSFIPDDQLFSHSERAIGKVVVITGVFECNLGKKV